MKWSTFRKVFIVLGAVYALALVPSSLKPSWNRSVVRKADQTVTIAAGSLDVHGRLQGACRAPWLLRPVMGPAKNVRVVTLNANGTSASVTELSCRGHA